MGSQKPTVEPGLMNIAYPTPFVYRSLIDAAVFSGFYSTHFLLFYPVEQRSEGPKPAVSHSAGSLFSRSYIELIEFLNDLFQRAHYIAVDCALEFRAVKVCTETEVALKTFADDLIVTFTEYGVAVT